MKNKQIRIILLLMLVSLTGVILIQIIWTNRAIKENRKKFDIEVSQALRETVDKLSRKDEIVFLSKHLTVNTEMNKLSIVSPDSMIKSEMIYISNQELFENDSSSNNNHITIKSNSSTYDKDSLNITITTEEKEKRAKDFTGLIEDIVVEYEASKKPVEERINKKDITNQLNRSFDRHNILLDYNFAVFKNSNNYISKLSDSKYNKEKQTYSSQLFPDEKNKDKYYLKVQFNSRNAYIIASINKILILSLLFTLALIATFIYTLKFVLNQKKISQIKTDFINNITHEFKTPITTISIAVDSLKNDKVKSDYSMQDYYTDIIKNENSKMNHRIEHILQLSLEKQNNKPIRPEKVNLSKLIEDCCDTFRLRINKLNGQISFYDNAENPNYYCEAEQVSTLICNIIDNAVKYSKEKPEIDIKLSNGQEQTIIEIKDRGIGITASDQKKIFERFYRVHTGDVHSVKGFGLGLSQAKSIVESYNGQIILKSVKGKGSIFKIILPSKHKIR